MNDKWINLKTLEELLSLEPYLLLGALLLVTWGFYKYFLKDLTEERHKRLSRAYSNLLRHFIVLSLLLGAFLFLYSAFDPRSPFFRITPYVALMTFTWGAVVFVKICRTLVLQYLFMGAMKSGVPVIIVNIFSTVLSIVLLFWAISQIFGVNLGPLLATSAAFSIILGLALQDTLGNLFAGISLQVDRCYEIGDWLEIQDGMQKTVGQVKEITWRSTILAGLSEEVVNLPNRKMAQAVLSNFSPPDQPIVRGQNFKLQVGTNSTKAVEVLEKTASEIFEIRGIPAPFAYINEVTENWLQVRLVYFIDSYGSQYVVGDKILRKCLEALERNQLPVAKQRLEVEWYAGNQSGRNSNQLPPG
jgi:small-conductance mechanosensitive channel